MNKLIAILLLFFIAISCNDNTVNDRYVYIPNVPVNITINMDLPLHYHLQTAGAYSLIKGGSRGIFLVHNFDGKYYAMERTCTYQSDQECAVIQIDSQLIQLRCGLYNPDFKECCSSRFGFDGNVIDGPAIYGLKQYGVYKNGNIITIKN